MPQFCCCHHMYVNVMFYYYFLAACFRRFADEGEIIFRGRRCGNAEY